MNRTRRLRLERLEVRDVPATLWYAQNFDTTPVGSVPTSWTQWVSDAVPSFAAASTPALSPPASLRSSGVSSRTAHAWYNQAAPADLQVSASIFADSLVPMRLFLRGSNLESGSPSYYAVTLTRGLNVQLNKVVNGVETTLGQLNSTSYTSGVWIRATLISQGNTLSIRLQRQDNNQFLNSSGQWTSVETNAISLTDTGSARNLGVPTSGFAGIARKAQYAGNVAVDNFQIETFGDTIPPTVSITSPSNGAMVSGNVAVAANATDNVGVTRVEFWMNNQLRATRTAAPYTWDLDTRTLPNGIAAVEVRAFDAQGNMGVAVRSFVVNNTTTNPGQPTIPQHYSHIRVAMLAYAGTPMTSFEQGLLQNSVDLVIPHEQYLSQIQTVAPNTPQLIYSNFSNVYLSLLTDWLEYADRNGINRENAFYHVTQPTAFTGGSPSSQPVNWLWDVRRESTNLTFAARDTTNADITFGGVGQSLYLGYTDKFRELNFTMSTGGANGWSGVVEYATAVNSAGQPTSWAPLTLRTDGTIGFRQSGRMTFDPPANWKAAKLNGSASLFYVRVRTATAGTTPVASTILGRDFVNATSNGQAGTIPVFDSAADANGDGYLTDAEFVNSAPGRDARFRHESRLFYPYYGPMRFVVNPAGAGVTGWAADYAVRFLNTHSLADGLFVDNSSGPSPVTGVSTVESSVNFTASYASLLGAVRQAIAPRWLLANTSGFYAQTNTIIPQVQGRLEEFLIRALSASTAQFEDVAALVRQRQLLNPSQYVILDSLPISPTPGVGSSTDATGRTQLATLAYYYMVANPQTTFLMMNGGWEPATSWTRHWSPAMAYNVGTPVGDWSVRATGNDPSNTALTYKVYQRNYSNALILYKPLSYRLGVGTGTAADNTATTHTLGGSYRALRHDGTLGPIITSISLRNGEGAILIPV